MTLARASNHLVAIENALRSARLLAASAAGRAGDLDHDGAFPAVDVGELGRLGLLAAPLPPRFGGLGIAGGARDAPMLARILRLVGSGSLPVGRLYEGHVNALRLIDLHATVEQGARTAAEVRAGRLFGVWNTDDRALPLRLEDDGAGGWRLAGKKILASGAGFIERPLVTACTPDGRLLMVLPHLPAGGRADLSGWTAHGMRASATGSVDFTGVAVAPWEILGQDGDYHRQPGFSGGAWRFAAVHLGGVEALLDLLRVHLRQTGRGEDTHQLVRLGEAAIAAETARLWVENAAVVAEDERGSPERIVAYVNLARLAVERAALDVIEIVHRSVGLASFVRPHPLERVARDLATYLRQPAPDRALTGAAAHVLGRAEPAGDLWA